MQKTIKKRKHIIPMQTANEYDALCKYPLCVFKNNTGIRKYTKRTYNKRQRQFEKKEIEKEIENND